MIKDWETHAHCRGFQHYFYPPSNESPKRAEMREAQAKAICGECTVRRQCLEHAEANPNDFVDLVMGGLSYVERLAAGQIPPRSSRARSKMERAANREAKRDQA